MKYKVVLFVLLSATAHSVHAMPVAPAPEETPTQKGAYFKKQCAQIAVAELAKKQRYINMLLHDNEYLENDEADKLAQETVKKEIKKRIKEKLAPENPVFKNATTLNYFLETRTNECIKEAQDEQALQASKKCYLRCCC